MKRSVNASDVISRIRKRNPSVGDLPIGVWGTMAHKSSVDTHEDRLPDVVCYANTDSVDLESEVVVPSGLDVGTYLSKNRNLFVDHQYDLMSTVGYCREMFKTKDLKAWVCRGQLHDTPYRSILMQLAAAGTLGMSIGFIPTDWGQPTGDEAKMYPGAESVVRKATVIEISYTALPCNVNCRQVATLDDSKSAAAMDIIAKSTVHESLLKVFSLDLLTRKRRKVYCFL